MKSSLSGTFFNRFIAMIRRDFWRKLIALFFAVLVYFTASQRISEEQIWNDVPVEVTLPADLIDTNPKPIYVSVRVRGSKRELQSKQKLLGRVEVRERDFVSGESYRLVLSPENFSSETGVRVISIDPKDQVQLLTLQRRLTRSVPVRAVFSGKLAADFERTAVKCIPATVEVTGPERTVKDILDITTESIPLDSSVTESFSYTTKLVNPAGLLIGAKNDSVQVQVAIAKNVENKRFSSVPVLVLNSPGGALRSELVSSDRVEVEVKGPRGAVAALKREQIRPYVDLSGTSGETTVDLPVHCFIDGGKVEVIQLIPAQIKVKISK